ncbi:hypothetical protein BDW02DRAFT_496705 [Decorospora gaudefroyi]|uniref:Pheromone-processing carboxypeptidase KEX1 n=1 Tax=Decorospora gaudefroyi TaxID=184978 RepID=A0A6A5KNJ1_9PLEO|nr:hypothetical protein BDW02DRAFT_496705 [Decorospora gaudefroyi]
MAAEKTQADYFIHDLPGAPKPLLKMHSGHIEVDAAHNSNLFFWHYENRHIADRQRTVLWLNGGPGCSSMDGAMMEIGPYRVRDGGKLEYNNGSWDEFANLLFVDQPVGTGFSYVNTDSYLTELDQMADHMIIFLEKWFALFPEYEHDDLYIAGESYAGQHIPYVGRAILNRNKNNAAKAPWALKGLLIGNGWMSPVDQYLAYIPFAYQNGLMQAGTDMAKRVENQQRICIDKLDKGGFNNVDTRECEAIMVTILEETKDTKADRMNQCLNMYDIRLRDDSSCGMNWPPDLEYVTPYLRRPDVIQALHINPDKKTGWQECNGAVSGHFRAKNSEPSVKFLPELIEQIPVLLFSGDKDFICNHVGTEAMIKNLEWNGGKGFEASPGVQNAKQDWVFEGEAAGTWQEARNLTYVVFYNSSHMVPFDYPRRTRDMLDRFVGVSIEAVGGLPADSLIDGEKGPLTSVGDHPNSTKAEEDKTKELQAAEWKAYTRSGEVALVVVIIVAGLWGIFLWRSRRANSEYKGVDGDEGRESLLTGMGLDNFRRRERRQDLEAADFDERELDDVDETAAKKAENGYAKVESEKEREPHNDSTFSLGADSEDEAGSSERGRRKEEPGEQYNGGNVKNPFEERVVNGFTASEIATLQSRLNKQLGPEYISQRPGNGGGRVAYLEGNKAIALANEVFGFNGWSSSLGQVQIDYIDEHQGGQVSLGLSIVVRITLKDGTYHEDIGYGSIQNGRSKAASFEKAKKEAATDGLKRSLRTFGNVLGNCLYDKEYLKKVQAMKVKPIKFQEATLYRHADFAPPPKEEDPSVVKREPQRTPVRPNQALRTRTDHLNSGSFGADFDDEADENLFDGVDATEGHGDEFSLSETLSAPETIEPAESNGVPSARTSPTRNTRGPRQPNGRPAPMQAGRNQPAVQHHPPNQGPPKPLQHVQNGRQPQTPVQQQPRPVQNGGRMPPPGGDNGAPSRPQAQQPQTNQQASNYQRPRPTVPQAQQAQQAPRPVPQANVTTTTSTTPATNPPPHNHRPPVGFVTSRAAELLQATEAPTSLTHLPSFNPNAESPIPVEKRTPGVDHARSIPIKRDAIPAPPPGQRAAPGSMNRASVVNPHLDMNRRIGMPGAGGAGGAGAGGYAMSPSANRGAYKPPTFAAGVKRERGVLTDVSNMGNADNEGANAEGPDAKKAKVEGGDALGVENTGVAGL